MGYKVLVTLDLPDATEEQRTIFYEELENKKWKKIPNLTTAWKASFADDVNIENAILIMEDDLQKAKNVSKVKRVDYAMQLDQSNVIINHK